MTETKHSTYRLSQVTKTKLLELAELDGVTQVEELNNLIQAEHRYRRDEIEQLRAQKAPKQPE